MLLSFVNGIWYDWWWFLHAFVEILLQAQDGVHHSQDEEAHQDWNTSSFFSGDPALKDHSI